MSKFQVKYSGKMMDQFPQNRFNQYPATAPAYEVLDENGASRFVGSHQACWNFIQIFTN
jgi:hypothetical protein